MQLAGLLVVFGCLFLGEIVISITKLPFPPSIVGLLILFGLLSFKKVSLTTVQPIAKLMLDYLVFMIVPACISIMQYLDIIAKDAFPLIVGTSISTLLVLFATGKTHSFVRRFLKNRGKSDE